MRTSREGRRALIEATVVPRSSREAVEGLRDGRLVIRVTSPPEKGKANEACLELLASRLGVSRSALSIAAGRSSRRKRILVEGMDPEEAFSRLGLSPGGA